MFFSLIQDTSSFSICNKNSWNTWFLFSAGKNTISNAIIQPILRLSRWPIPKGQKIFEIVRIEINYTFTINTTEFYWFSMFIVKFLEPWLHSMKHFSFCEWPTPCSSGRPRVHRSTLPEHPPRPSRNQTAPSLCHQISSEAINNHTSLKLKGNSNIH